MDLKVILEISEKKALIKVDGPITSENAHLFGDELNKVLASEAVLCELDFSACRNISSSGIGKLLLFYKEFLNRDGEIEVVKSSSSVYEIFNTIKLNQLFPISL